MSGSYLRLLVLVDVVVAVAAGFDELIVVRAQIVAEELAGLGGLVVVEGVALLLVQTLNTAPAGGRVGQ